MKITKEDIPTIKKLIKEYSAHDVEAFESRTKLFEMAMDLANALEEELKK